MPRNFENRLARLAGALAKQIQEKDLSNCSCGDPKRIFMPRSGVDMAVQLTAELTLRCPVHHEGRLSRLLWAEIIGSDGKRIPNPEMDPIVEEFERRYERQSEQVPNMMPKTSSSPTLKQQKLRSELNNLSIRGNTR
jgi:hypothetical protein